MVNKRFAVLTKIVDYLIEPYITDAGYDFYDDGFCWKYFNYIYFGAGVGRKEVARRHCHVNQR